METLPDVMLPILHIDFKVLNKRAIFGDEPLACAIQLDGDVAEALRPHASVVERVCRNLIQDVLDAASLRMPGPMRAERLQACKMTAAEFAKAHGAEHRKYGATETVNLGEYGFGWRNGRFVAFVEPLDTI